MSHCTGFTVVYRPLTELFIHVDFTVDSSESQTYARHLPPILKEFYVCPLDPVELN